MLTNPIAVVLEAMEIVSDIVGSTLGPGGRPVLIERQEYGVPPFVSKDGVTVYKALGFDNALKDLVMEAIRDPAVHTANEAGDGTTTATILSASIIKRIHDWHKANPTESPQRVSRSLQGMLVAGLEFLQERSVAATMRLPTGEADQAGMYLLRAVARTSANGDDDIAEAALKAMFLAGDVGNVVLTEASGAGYEVEKIDGYSLQIGWEDTAKSLASNWFTDSAREICRVEGPRVLVYNGRLTSLAGLKPLLEQVIRQSDVNRSDDVAQILALGVESGVIEPRCNHKSGQKECGKELQLFQPTARVAHPTWGCPDHAKVALEPLLDECRRLDSTVVVMASSFSESVLTDFFMNFRNPDGIRLVPILAPHGPTAGYQLQVMQDVAAIAGSTIVDPISVWGSNLSCLGPGIAAFEMSRLRGNFEGLAFKTAKHRPVPYRNQLAARINGAEQQLKAATSTLDKVYVQERLAKLTGGLIRLVVRGTSNADLRERRDRVEDAICAIRGASREGCLPGACWGLFALAQRLLETAPEDQKQLVDRVMGAALRDPFVRLLSNAGYAASEIGELSSKMDESVAKTLAGTASASILDVVSRSWVDPYEAGILDSTPAVDRAVRSACAQMQMGYLGGIVAYKRDSELERREALAATAHGRAVAQGDNEANERG